MLGRPVADVTECPVLQPADVKAVVADLEAILHKCLYAVRLRMVSQLGAFLSLLAQATVMQGDRVVRGMSQRAEEGTCLDLFCELTAQMLARVNAALRLGVDVELLFEVVQAVCADAKLKDKVGGVLGKLLLNYMHDSAQHADDYRVHRGCASALITLLRGSSANKNRFGAECGRIADCLERSSDFFFQMQCVEVLFRLFTHNRTVLAQATMNDTLRRGIQSLPNDATLLLSIQSFLDSYNAEFNADCVVPFTIVRMEIDGVEVCSHTTMYFSPLLLVVLLPGSMGDNFTIPFEHIRSVKLSKDHKLGLRLNVIPSKLCLLMNLEEGKDTLHVFLTQSTLARLRSCCVHQWITDRKRSAPRRVLAPTAPPAAGGSAVPPPPLRPRRNEEEEDESDDKDHSFPSGVHGDQGSRHGSRAGSRTASAHVTPRPGSSGGGGGTVAISEREPNRPSPSKTRPVLENGEQESDSRLDEVHRAAAVKATRHREEQLQQLQHTADSIQGELEDLHRLSARDRDSFEAAFREDLTAIRRAEASLKDSAAECIQSLNAELEDIQALGALLKVEADKLRERLAKSLGKSEGVEEACLLRIKKLVDTRMIGMEGSLSRIVTEANPLTGVSQYLGHRIADLSASDTRTKARKLEFS